MIALPIRPFPVLQLGNFKLRQLSEADAREIFLLRSDENVNRYLDRPKAISIKDGLQFINRINSNIENGESLYWALIPPGESHLAGTICYWNIERETSKAEIGYELLPSFQGRGIIQDILPGFLGYGFNILGLRRIEAVLHGDNLRSVRILEKFRFYRDVQAEEKMDHAPGDGLVIYALDNKANPHL